MILLYLLQIQDISQYFLHHREQVFPKELPKGDSYSDSDFPHIMLLKGLQLYVFDVTFGVKIKTFAFWYLDYNPLSKSRPTSKTL